MHSLRRKILSLLNLAVFFVLHWFRKIFAPQSGLGKFLDNYPEAKILSLDEKKMFQGLSRCTACQKCNEICPALQMENPIHFMGPMAVPLTYARSLYFIDSVKIPWDICKDCGKCEPVCPERVPLNQGLVWLAAQSKYDPQSSPNLGVGEKGATNL